MLGGNLSASLVPLIDTINGGIATSSNFVEADFLENTGLQANGSNKYLQLKPTASQFMGLGYWETNLDSGGSNTVPIGANETGDQSRWQLDLRNNSSEFFSWGPPGGGGAIGTLTGGGNNHYYGQRTSTTESKLYRDGVGVVSSSANITYVPTAVKFRVFGVGPIAGNDYYYSGRSVAAYITDGTLTATEVSELHTILSNFVEDRAGNPVYFGPTTPTDYSAGFQQWGTYTIYSSPTDTSYICPGTGSKRLNSLQFWGKSNGSSGVARFAVFDTSLNLIGQGVTTVTATTSRAQWLGNVGYNSLKPVGGNAGDPVYLTGGTQYVFAFSTDNANVMIGYKSVGTTTSSSYWKNTNYSGGFPTNMTAGTQFTERLPIRIGVTS